MAATVELKDRFRGSLLGLAVGNAVGATVDNMTRGSFPPVTDMVGGGRYRLLPGQVRWDKACIILCQLLYPILYFLFLFLTPQCLTLYWLFVA